MSALDDIRERMLLPSDLLAYARELNPQLQIDLVEATLDRPTRLQIRTGRGDLEYERDPRERWADVFARSGLLRRPG